MLDNTLKEQLQGIFSDLKNSYTFDIYVSKEHQSRNELLELLGEVAECSQNIECKVNDGDSLQFFICKNGERTGISFRAVPNGHEFNSLLLTILNLDGKGKNLPDGFIAEKIKNLNGKIHLTTYVSLTCTNCPDVVQALNAITIFNPNITHETVDGAINQAEAEHLNIQGVPAVFADGKMLHSGRGDLLVLLNKLEEKYGSKIPDNQEIIPKEYDVAVIGGGPAGAAAAIYSARKGLTVAIVAERMGGQVNETVDIENVISVPKTTGAKLASDLKQHIENYSIEVFEHRKVEKIALEDGKKHIYTSANEVFIAPAVIIATGASWRKLNVDGEQQYIGRGVHFCPHCDGPFYKNKRVAVIGGGNSGIEAAIDLAGIAEKVTVFEFLDELRADKVLQQKAYSLTNVEILLSRQTVEVLGNGDKVTGLKVKNRQTDEEKLYELDGVFVQIGLVANSAQFSDLLTVNRVGEIEIDAKNRTGIAGIYAAGDVSTVPYKQIIVSMGEGAKAALTAFDDRIRNLI
ncbi:MAG: alkyl hydroperoxide reductase subunit F [Prevotellaceae bacterium]|jgi:alkyl hydroperoxide reductase subunit F|nr:alkyl hydroperoxide reductase subunit F [Prevotellaceae bacterium]